MRPLLLLLFMMISSWSWAQFLPVDQAFNIRSQQDQNWLLIDIDIKPGHYLYQKSLRVEGPEAVVLGDLTWQQQPEWTFDPFFKEELAVFYQQLNLAIPVATQGLSELTLHYQGCAEAGLCYPPQRVPLIVLATASTELPENLVEPFAHAGLGEKSSDSAVNQQEDAKANASSDSRMNASGLNSNLTTSSGLLGFLQQIQTWQALMLFFALGLALTFTPCVLPMVPILSAIVMGGQQRTRGRTFALSLSFVIPMALTYAVLGLLLASLGASANLTAMMQRSEVLVALAMLLVFLAMVTLGWLKLPMPAGFQQWLTQLQAKPRGGHYLGVASMGVLSALIVSPCISAPLAALMLFITLHGDLWLGFWLLLFLGLGMGTPLLLVAQGGAHWLPKSGPWLERSKEVLAAMLILLALWLVSRLVAGPVLLWLYGAALLAVVFYLAYWLWRWQSSARFFFLWLLALLMSYALALILGGYMGNSDWRRPMIASPEPIQEFRSTSEPEQLNHWLSQGQASVLFVTADWCVSCRVMNRDLFGNPQIQELLQDWKWLALDITDNTSQQQQWLTQESLFGPPALLFFDDSGQLMPELTIQGEISRSAFVRHWQQHGYSNNW